MKKSVTISAEISTADMYLLPAMGVSYEKYKDNTKQLGITFAVWNKALTFTFTYGK